MSKCNRIPAVVNFAQDFTPGQPQDAFGPGVWAVWRPEPGAGSQTRHLPDNPEAKEAAAMSPAPLGGGLGRGFHQHVTNLARA